MSQLPVLNRFQLCCDYSYSSSLILNDIEEYLDTDSLEEQVELFQYGTPNNILNQWFDVIFFSVHNEVKEEEKKDYVALLFKGKIFFVRSMKENTLKVYFYPKCDNRGSWAIIDKMKDHYVESLIQLCHKIKDKNQ